MLNSIQLAVLEYLVNNNEELINDFSRQQHVSNPSATIGVGKFLIADSANFTAMSSSQQYHYDTVLKPLVVEVPCAGMLGMLDEHGTSSCQGNGFIADENLLEAYQLDSMLCEQCTYTSEAWHRNNP